MFDPKSFPFDPEQIAAFFKENDFTKALTDMKMPNMDADSLMAAQKKNMDAFVEANKAAAAGYQDLFTKQLEVFEATLAEAKKQIGDFDIMKADADVANERGEVAKAAFEKALANMKELAEGAQKANAEAYEVVTARIKESVKELQDLAK